MINFFRTFFFFVATLAALSCGGGSGGGSESTVSGGGISASSLRLLSANTNLVSIDEQSLTADITKVTFTFTPETSSVVLGLPLSASELIYGLSERLYDSRVIRPSINGPMEGDLDPIEIGTLNRRGQVVEMFVRPTMALYAPFFQSSLGYGVWIEGTMPGVFDVGVSDSDTLKISYELSPSASERKLTVYLLQGPNYKDILRQYHSLVGFPVRLPDWAFSHWRWRDSLVRGSFTEVDGALVNADVADDILMYEKFGIPFGVYLFDRPYLLGSDDADSGGFGSFDWDESIVANPAHTIAALKRRGSQIAVWITSWALGRNGDEARSQGFLAPNTDRVIDLTNPAAYDWWKRKLSAFFAAWGINGVKLDRGEEFVPSGSADIWHNGKSGRELHNEFPVLASKVVHDALWDIHGANSSVIARAAYSGAQSFAGHWGGDTPGHTDLGLRTAIIQLQRAAFLGYPNWGSDTGGYTGFGNRELFARWLQFSALCPIMEIGGQGSHAPWDMPSAPKVDTELIEIYRRYVSLHHELIPVTAQLADQASSSGTPIARPMIVEFPEDARFLDAWDQYMYGPDLLVAPVWRTGQRKREVILPAGTWEWYWDNAQSFEGPATIVVDAPLDTLPLFRRR